MSAVLKPSAATIELPDDLNNRQKLFVIHYLETRNGTQSAKLAGYEGSDDVLAVTASRLLNHAKVKEALESYFKSRILSANGVLSELSDIAFAPLSDMEAKVTENGIIPPILRPADKIKSLELVGKFHGLFMERSESVNVNIDLNGSDLASILQGALSAGAIDVSDTAIDVTPEPISRPIDETDQA